MTRSVWKGPFVDGYLLKKAEASQGSGRKDVIKTWSYGESARSRRVKCRPRPVSRLAKRR